MYIEAYKILFFWIGAQTIMISKKLHDKVPTLSLAGFHTMAKKQPVLFTEMKKIVWEINAKLKSQIHPRLLWNKHNLLLAKEAHADSNPFRLFTEQP